MKTLLTIFGISMLFFLVSFNQRELDYNLPLNVINEHSVSNADDSTKKLDVTATSTGRALYRNKYTFGHKLSYVTKVVNGATTETSTLSVYYCDGAIMISTPEVSSIADYEIESAMTLLEVDKIGFVGPRNFMEDVATKYGKKDPLEDYIKTGNTKQILGFNCEEYTLQDKKTQSTLWISTEVKMPYDKLELFAHGYYKDISGMLMESTTIDKKGIKTHMIMSEFKEEVTIKTFEGYKITIV